MAMTVSGRMRPLDIRRDLDGLGELIEIAFAGELARRGGDLRAELRLAQRMVPLILVLSQVFEGFRHVLDGFVWEDRGRIVASAMVQRMGNDETRWYVGSVATHPDYRRRGLARLLVTRAMEHARAHGAEVCILDVRADNLPAYKLYLSLGYLHYDSTTELKLEELPLVQAKHRREPSRTAAGGYRLRPMKMGEWQARYDLAVRETPAEVQAFLPVSKAQYRVSTLQRLVMPLLIRLQRIDTHRWAAERDGRLVGLMRLSASRVPGTTHELSLTVDPTHRDALAEPLLTLALETLQKYPRQNTLVSVRAAYADLLDLLKRYGFVEIETKHRLGVKLERNPSTLSRTKDEGRKTKEKTKPWPGLDLCWKSRIIRGNV